VTVAHLEPHKNQGSVIRAVAVLKHRHPALRYLMIGKGPDRAPLEKLAASLGVADRVSFAGPLPHERALEELARCHVHVMPSTHDAFGVSHIEAMAAGLPSVGGAGTGAEDIAAAGDGLLLVTPGDPTVLVRTLDDLLGDERRLAGLGAAARETVADHFTWARNGAETATLYRQLVR
jgi:glycosyltransferase involved in cell wall biosynthesis